MFDTIRQQFFPCVLADSITVEAVPDTTAFWSDAAPLMEAIFPPYASIGAYGYAVPEERRAKLKPLAEAFARTHHEYFSLRTDDGTPIGFSYGDMRDGQTFFMTSTGILPAYQRKGIYTAFLKRLLTYLFAAGYERVLSNHHPNNRAVIIAKLKAGFNITALTLDERWGSQAELTYLFHDDRRQIFARAFAQEERPIPVSHLQANYPKIP